MHDTRLRGGSGMQIVGLELIGRNAFQHEGDERDIMLPCQFRVHVAELPGVARSVVGRQLHADQQHFRVRFFYPGNDPVEIFSALADGRTAQAVVGAQFEYDHCRPVLLQCLADTPQSAGSRFATDACIDYFELRTVFFQFMLQ